MKKAHKLLDAGTDFRQELDKKYTAKILAPIYEPSMNKPSIFKLYDDSKAKLLIRRIKASKVADDEKAFLIQAARRHIIFNYGMIADYYANSEKEMQELMEQSALVIIDFDKAIENGYVKLSEDVAAQYLEDTKNVE